MQDENKTELFERTPIHKAVAAIVLAWLFRRLERERAGTGNTEKAK